MRSHAAALALALAGCGGEGSPASVVPADTPVYVSVATAETARPPGVAEPARLLVDSLELEGVDYRRDVAPWIGERAAFFSTGEEGAALVLTARDEDAAQAFGDRVRASGGFRAEVVEGQLVLATSRELVQASIDAAQHDALAESGRFDPGDERGDDAPAALFTASDVRAAAGAARSSGLLPKGAESFLIELLPAEGTATARMWLDSKAVRLDIEGLGPPGPPAPTLENLPADTWLAVATPDLGELVLTGAGIGYASSAFQRLQLASGLDLDSDVLPGLGAGTFYAHGDGSDRLGARLRAEARDEPGLRRAAVALARTLSRAEGVSDVDFTHLPRLRALDLTAYFDELDPTDSGFAAYFYMTIEDGNLTVTLGDDPGPVSEAFAETSVYRDAERRLGHPPTLLVDLDRLSELLPAAARLGRGYLASTQFTKGGRRVDRFVLSRF